MLAKIMNHKFLNFWAFQSGGKWLTMHVPKTWTTMMNCKSFSRQLMVILEFKFWKNYGILTLEMTTTKKDKNVLKRWCNGTKMKSTCTCSWKFPFVSLSVLFCFLLQVMRKMFTWTLVAWGGWVLQIFCEFFFVPVQNNGENTSYSNGENPWRLSRCKTWM